MSVPIEEFNNDYNVELFACGPREECAACGSNNWELEKQNEEKNNLIFSICCNRGQTVIPDLPPPPNEICELLQGETSQSKYFLKNIRAFNCALAMSSIGGDITHLVRGGQPVFQVHGIISHCIGHLLPLDAGKPKFASIWIHDTDEQLEYRSQLNGLNSNEATEILKILQPALSTIVLFDNFTTYDRLLWTLNN